MEPRCQRDPQDVNTGFGGGSVWSADPVSAARVAAKCSFGCTVRRSPAAAPHILARPHVLALPVMVAWIATLIRAVDTRTSPPWLLLPLMTLWANLHGSYVRSRNDRAYRVRRALACDTLGAFERPSAMDTLRLACRGRRLPQSLRPRNDPGDIPDGSVGCSPDDRHRMAPSGFHPSRCVRSHNAWCLWLCALSRSDSAGAANCDGARCSAPESRRCVTPTCLECSRRYSWPGLWPNNSRRSPATGQDWRCDHQHGCRRLPCYC